MSFPMLVIGVSDRKVHGSCGAVAGLELPVQIMLLLQPQRPTSLCLLSAGLKGWLVLHKKFYVNLYNNASFERPCSLRLQSTMSGLLSELSAK